MSKQLHFVWLNCGLGDVKEVHKTNNIKHITELPDVLFILLFCEVNKIGKNLRERNNFVSFFFYTR